MSVKADLAIYSHVFDVQGYCKSVGLMFSNKLDINSCAVRDGFCKSSHNSILKTTFNQASLLYYFIICLWSETVGNKTVIITSICRISLLLTLNLMLHLHSHVVTMISYSCLWYNYNIATSHDSSTTMAVNLSFCLLEDSHTLILILCSYVHLPNLYSYIEQHCYSFNAINNINDIINS